MTMKARKSSFLGSDPKGDKVHPSVRSFVGSPPHIGPLWPQTRPPRPLRPLIRPLRPLLPEVSTRRPHTSPPSPHTSPPRPQINPLMH